MRLTALNPPGPWRMLSAILVVVCWSAAHASDADPVGWDLLQRDVELQNETLTNTHRAALESLDLANHTAMVSAADQFTALLASIESNHPQLRKVQLNAAIAYTAVGDTESAMKVVTAALASAMVTLGPYHLELIPYMLAEGDVLARQDQPSAAISAYQRAQNVSHRQMGVYNPDQMTAIERVIRVAANRGTRRIVETQLRLMLKIAEESLGGEDVARLQLELAAHYKRRCDSTDPSIRNDPEAPGVPLRFAFGQIAAGYYKDAIETLAGLEESEQQLYAMRNLAHTWSLIDRQRRSRKSIRAYIASAREIYANNESALARALVHAGDIHMILGDQQAFSAYREAWQLLEQDPDLQGSLLGTPVRLKPASVETAFLARKPESTNHNDPLYVHFGFTVRENGRPAKVQTLYSNVFAEQRRVSRSRLMRMIFRPRFKAGVAVPTAGFEHVQPFRVGAPDALLPWNQKKLEAKRAAEKAADASRFGDAG